MSITFPFSIRQATQWLTQLGVIYRLAEGALSPTVLVADKDWACVQKVLLLWWNYYFFPVLSLPPHLVWLRELRSGSMQRVLGSLLNIVPFWQVIASSVPLSPSQPWSSVSSSRLFWDLESVWPGAGTMGPWPCPAELTEAWIKPCFAG